MPDWGQRGGQILSNLKLSAGDFQHRISVCVDGVSQDNGHGYAPSDHEHANENAVRLLACHVNAGDAHHGYGYVHVPKPHANVHGHDVPQDGTRVRFP